MKYVGVMVLIQRMRIPWLVYHGIGLSMVFSATEALLFSNLNLVVFLFKNFNANEWFWITIG